MQDAEAGHIQPFGRAEDLDAALGQRQQHGVDDALVGLAPGAVLGVAARHRFTEAVVVQVHQPRQHEAAGTVMDNVRTGRAGGRDGSDSAAFQHNPVIPEHLLHAFMPGENIAAEDQGGGAVHDRMCGMGCERISIS